MIKNVVSQRILTARIIAMATAESMNMLMWLPFHVFPFHAFPFHAFPFHAFPRDSSNVYDLTTFRQCPPKPSSVPRQYFLKCERCLVHETRVFHFHASGGVGKTTRTSLKHEGLQWNSGGDTHRSI